MALDLRHQRRAFGLWECRGAIVRSFNRSWSVTPVAARPVSNDFEGAKRGRLAWLGLYRRDTRGGLALVGLLHGRPGGQPASCDEHGRDSELDLVAQ